MKEKILKSRDGIDVLYVEGISHPHRTDILEEVIGRVYINGRSFFREEVQMDRVIGLSHCVERRKGDEYKFYDRGRGYESTMVMNRNAEPTVLVSVIICIGNADDGEYEGKYLLVTLFDGPLGEPEPYGQYEHDTNSIAFWETHALVPTEEERAAIVQKEKEMKK